MTSSAGWRGEKAQGGGKGSGTATSGGLRGIGGQLASTMCPLSAHHPCLSLCQISKTRLSLYITLQVSMRIVAGSVCMVFSRYAIAEYFSSQFVDRKAPSNIVQEYCYGIAVRMFYLVGGFMRQGG